MMPRKQFCKHEQHINVDLHPCSKRRYSIKVITFLRELLLDDGFRNSSTTNDQAEPHEYC